MRDEHRPHAFASRAHTAFKEGGARRLLGAAAAALVLLALLVLLGPDQEEVKRRFEYYGAPGELRIMPEISIDDGRDAVHQLPKSLQQPPPPAEIVVEPESDDPDAEDTVARPREGAPTDRPPVDLVADAEQASEAQVELALPQQRNPDWFILHQVRPDYPVDAPEAERRQPLVFVEAAIFVGRDGRVTESMITATNGGPTYGRAVLAAVDQWVFGWRVDPGAGRWIEMTWNFRSPYFSGAGARLR
ncbi:MAG: hypothetical protein ABR506_09990 [Candidatus Krumholzibacteriia bacterium]